MIWRLKRVRPFPRTDLILYVATWGLAAAAFLVPTPVKKEREIHP